MELMSEHFKDTARTGPSRAVPEMGAPLPDGRIGQQTPGLGGLHARVATSTPMPIETPRQLHGFAALADDVMETTSGGQFENPAIPNIPRQGPHAHPHALPDLWW